MPVEYIFHCHINNRSSTFAMPFIITVRGKWWSCWWSCHDDPEGDDLDDTSDADNDEDDVGGNVVGYD